MRNEKKEVIGILTADWHLSNVPPILRSKEPDWYAAMLRPIFEIQRLATRHACPIYHAGDLFDKWLQPPHLIYFTLTAILQFDSFNAVVGQHDIPNHNINEIHRSAFGLLDFLGRIQRNEYARFTNSRHKIKMLSVQYFDHGKPIKPAKKKSGIDLRMAIVHKYAWTGEHKHEKAKPQDRVPTSSRNLINGKLFGYDVIVYGDNHDGFITRVGNTTVFNCGTIIKRSRNELGYSLQVGLLLEDGTVRPHFLDTSKDIYLAGETEREMVDKLDRDMLEKFKATMDNLGTSATDILQCWSLYCQQKEVTTGARNLIQEFIDDYKQ